LFSVFFGGIKAYQKGAVNGIDRHVFCETERMRCAVKEKNLKMSLGKNKLFSLNGVKKALLTCEQGRLWITGTKDGDIIVKSGEAVLLRPQHSLVIQGSDESMFSMEIN
jgi:site-specific DNA-cytosine methylase